MGLTRIIALDIIWDTIMNTKLFGVWLSVRWQASSSIRLLNSFQRDDHILFLDGLRHSFWPILYQHGFNCVMGGGYGPMVVMKMSGSGGEYGGISRGNEL